MNNDLNSAFNMLDGYISYHIIHKREKLDEICKESIALDKESIGDICDLYGYPITIIQELQYTDKMYRDAYYVYLSHLHFDVPRNCQRLSLFKTEIPFEDFFDNEKYDQLQKKLLGTIVIRPSYNISSEYTIGRTLLDPIKMVRPLKYIRTAKYKAVICGHKYIINAFPFSNQHVDILRCAETSVWSLMEYFGARYENYQTVLPSTIMSWESTEMAQRSLPSDGMTYSQISGLLKTFGFEPLIYVSGIYKESEELKNSKANMVHDSYSEKIDELKNICNDSSEYLAEKQARKMDQIILNRYKNSKIDVQENRETSLHNLFHYYVESGIPLITAICNERESINHSIVIIGHDERSPIKMEPKNINNNCFEINEIKYIDSSDFYERYITIDDNQYPYRSERYNHFAISQNCKVKAFIVPLYRHILLSAEAAINIIEEYIRDFSKEIQCTLELLKQIEKDTAENSLDNPLVLRYYLTASRSFVDFRNRSTDYIEEKIFYDSTPYPKFIWVCEFSPLEFYKVGKVVGEIVVDATAPRYSGTGAIISFRIGGICVSRKTNEAFESMKEKLVKNKELKAQFLYDLYTNNLQKGDF